MNKEKTVLQMLIEEIKSMKSVATTEQRRYAFQQVLDWLDVGVFIEQEQIEKAFEDGIMDCGEFGQATYAMGVRYFQSKYGGEV